MWSVYHSHKFDKEELKQLSHEEQREADVFFSHHLVNDPYVGEPLGFHFFREKKIGHKRIYFLIYDDLKAVLLVHVSNKKAQEKTIEEIKKNLHVYKEEVRKLALPKP